MATVSVPKLDPQYKWLLTEANLPRILRRGLETYGTTEVPGPGNSDILLTWAKVVGQSWYTSDSIPWCGLAVAYWTTQAGYKPPSGSLRALNWATWGTEVKLSEAAVGDILVFSRAGGGHVGLYIGEDSTAFHVYGGNQGDKVCITRVRKDRLVAVRRTKWANAQPLGVRKVTLKPTGQLSTNEA